MGVEKKLPSKLMEPSKSEKLVEVRKNMSLIKIEYRLIDIVDVQ